MIDCSMKELAGKIGAISCSGDARFDRVGIDTRTLQSGALFVAIKGPNFDGHDFISKAQLQGAVGAMVSCDVVADIPVLRVDDTRIGLGQLASFWRDKSGAQMVAITGSNGKTTVKEMVSAILRQAGSVLSTQGNLNNDIGVPLTLLRLQDEQFAVIEMGASAAGEIDYLSRMARPQVAVLNNACRSHLEGFGSLEGVARAKGEIAAGLSDNGVFVFNADDSFSGYWKSLLPEAQQLTFGVNQSADVSSPSDSYQISWKQDGFVSRFEVHTPKENFNVELPLAGEHNRMNALAAIAATHALGIEPGAMQQGLASLMPVKGRLQPLRTSLGTLFIDDTYNANPDSVKAAISVLAHAPGRRFLVLGELAELGNETEAFYREIGEFARASGIERLYSLQDAAMASECFGEGGQVFEDVAALVGQLQGEITQQDVVLVKGSRSAGMEQVVYPFTESEVS